MKKMMLMMGVLALVMPGCQESDDDSRRAKERKDIVFPRQSSLRLHHQGKEYGYYPLYG